MKIVLVNSLYPPDIVGGAEKSVMLLAEALVALGHEIVVVCLTKERQESVDHLRGVKVYRLPLKNLYWPFSAEQRASVARSAWHLLDIHNPLMSRSLSRIFLTEKPHVVQTHNLTGFSVSAWHAASKLKIPVNHVLHDYALLCPKTTMYKNGNCAVQCASCRVFTAHKKTSSALVNGIVGISEYILTRHQAAHYFPNAMAGSVIHNILETAGQAAGQAAGSAGPRAGDGHLVFGFMGQIVPSKGLDRFLETLSEYEREDWRVVIAGRGSRDYVDRLTDRFSSDRIRFIGFSSHENFFRQIDVLAMPSLWQEPFGRTALDGLVWRKPVLATRRGGLPDIVVSGKTGWLYDPDDAEELRAILAALFRTKAPPSISDDSRSGILEKFAPGHIAGKYLAHLHKIIDRHS